MKHKSTGSAGSGLSLQSIGDHQSGQPTTPPLSTLRQEKAHRYMGYPAFSSLLSSDNDSFVVRKFGTLHVRTILMLQDKIAELEDRLAVIDRDVQERQGDEYLCHNGSFRGDQQWHDERYEMMLNLARLLEQYDSLVLKYTQLKQQPEPTKRTLKNLDRWFNKYPRAITDYETGFLSEEKQHDLIATAVREKTPLRRGLERFSRFRRWRLFRLKPSRKVNEYEQKYGEKGVTYYDDEVVDKVVMGIILFLGLFMLLVPAWLLKQFPSHTTRLAIISGFVALFVGLLLLVTPSKPFETMVGTAAYGALLMVFMQIDN